MVIYTDSHYQEYNFIFPITLAGTKKNKLLWCVIKINRRVRINGASNKKEYF